MDQAAMAPDNRTIVRRSELAQSPIVPTDLARYAHGAPNRSVMEERLYRKQRLAVALRVFARLDFAMGPSGHFTARDPEWHDHFWVNPFLRHFSLMRVSDLILVNHKGVVVEGVGTVNGAGFAIHSELHKSRPDVIGAVHVHSPYGKAWSSFGREVEPLCQDSAVVYGDQAIFDAYSGVVADLKEGERIASALGSKNNVILKNHGLLSVAHCVETAAWRYIAFDNACRIQLLASAAGGGDPMPAAVAAQTNTQVGCELAGIYSFEPYLEQIVAQEPDVLN